MTKQETINKFIETLENEGEMFFSSGDVKQDYSTITNVIKGQGYWSGTKYRYYFDDNFNLINTTERW
jgi:hypothetical protein